MTQLRLIKSDVSGLSSQWHDLDFVESSLSRDAKLIEIWRGRNKYSEFLRKYGKRPNPMQAAAIGLLMSARVLDQDGRLQPPSNKLAKREIAARRQQKLLRVQARRAFSLVSEIVEQAALAPKDVVRHASANLDQSAIRLQLKDAICWLQQIDAEFEIRDSEALPTA